MQCLPTRHDRMTILDGPLRGTQEVATGHVQEGHFRTIKFKFVNIDNLKEVGT